MIIMKKTFKLLLVLVAVISTTYACTNKSNSNSENSTTEFVDVHTSQNSLDWPGTYSGILPCADCEGIETELKIKSDNTYSLTTSYLGKEDPLTETIEGSFEWLEDGNNIKLGGINEGSRSPFFKIEENRLRYLDMDGNVIKSDLEDFYILTKEGNPMVENKKWQLMELNGKEVEGSNPENYFIIFNSEEGVAHAKANCNSLGFSYKIKNVFRLELKQGMSTMMACPDGNVEREFLEVLNTVDNLSTDGSTLTLNKARMAPLAKFVLVEE